MPGYARSLVAPNPDLLVPLSGIVIIAGGLMIALGVWAAALIIFYIYNQGQDLDASLTDALFGSI